MKLQPHNLHIERTKDWKLLTDEDGHKFCEAPTKDMWELIDTGKPWDGEQLFTFKAALREAKKQGLRIPTDEEWTQLAKTKSDIPNLVLTGSRGTDGSFGSRGTYASFWSSTPSGSNAWRRGLHSSNATVYRNAYDKAYGFAVRCLGTESDSFDTSTKKPVWTHTCRSERSDGIVIDGEQITIDGEEFTKDGLREFVAKCRAALTMIDKIK